CSTGVFATVTLNASAVSADTITCTLATPFSSNVATYLAVKPPGLLGGCKNTSGLPFQVVGATATTPIAVAMSGGGTATVDQNGGFTAAGGGGTQTFSVQVQNSLGTATTAGTANVTVTFASANGPTVTVLDAADRKTTITDYRWVIEEDQTFYVDP